ncbi:hypothetical protein STEG23_015336 [Scotinomys teguina]
MVLLTILHFDEEVHEIFECYEKKVLRVTLDDAQKVAHWELDITVNTEATSVYEYRERTEKFKTPGSNASDAIRQIRLNS